jgi:hypothetical protein
MGAVITFPEARRGPREPAQEAGADALVIILPVVRIERGQETYQETCREAQQETTHEAPREANHEAPREANHEAIQEEIQEAPREATIGAPHAMPQTISRDEAPRDSGTDTKSPSPRRRRRRASR